MCHSGREYTTEEMQESVLDDDQLKSWREEQLTLASKVNQPHPCSLTVEQCHPNNNLSTIPSDYSHRFQHMEIPPGNLPTEHNNPFRIGGVDVSYPQQHSTTAAIAVYIILQYSHLLSPPVVVYRSHLVFTPPPYVPSYLSFREGPPLLSLISKQLQSHPQYTPHVVMVDGNGRWHDRRAGLACFVGQCGIPCIGVGKSWYGCNGRSLNVKNAVEKSVREWHALWEGTKRINEERFVNGKCVVLDSVSFLQEAASESTGDDVMMEQMLSRLSTVAYGLAVPMIDDTSPNGETLAYALLGQGGHDISSTTCEKRTASTRRGRRGSKKPIYISVGDNIALRDAVVLVAYTCGASRIPEPVREADIYGRRLLREGMNICGNA